ncbi:hypothetical protein HZA55_01550 [Candidatus Poribacteria bacterium]|nr:hypothetical protein [Candidatus Poribacteria bacterium]
MKIECPECKAENDFNDKCSNCHKSINFFPRIIYFGDREEHLIITLTSILGIVLGGVFGYMSTGDQSATLTFITTAVCANVGIIPGYLVGKTTLVIFNAIISLNAFFQYSSIILMGGIHGLIYTIVLIKASKMDMTFFNLATGFVTYAVFVLSSILYIRKNVKEMNNWW